MHSFTSWCLRHAVALFEVRCGHVLVFFFLSLVMGPKGVHALSFLAKGWYPTSPTVAVDKLMPTLNDSSTVCLGEKPSIWLGMMMCFDSWACDSATLSTGYTILSIYTYFSMRIQLCSMMKKKRSPYWPTQFSVTCVTCKHSTVELADLVDGLMYRDREKRWRRNVFDPALGW